MKVLLLNIMVGDGLKKICDAVALRLKEQNIECKTVDVYEKDPKSVKRCKDNYYRLVKVVPRIARLVQHSLCYYNKKRVIKNTSLFKADLKALCKTLPTIASGYDVIFTPVGFIAVALQMLRKGGSIDAKTKIVFCVPDFNIPVGSELLTEADAIITPCQEVFDYYKARGLKNLYNLGVPVDKKFLEKCDRGEVCKQLNIENRHTILYMCGGIGFGKTHKVVKKMHNRCDAQIIVVNGRNQKEKQKIDNWIHEKNVSGVINLGYCNNVDKLMCASDVIISKTGMVTMAEAASKGLVIANVKQLLYPEYDNMLHLKKHGAGYFCKRYKTLFERLNNANFDSEAKNFKKLFNLSAGDEIVELLKRLA